MINGISSASSYLTQIQAMQRNRGNGFSNVDTDSDGSVNQSEFDAFVVNLSGQSSTSIYTESAFSTYDADGDGSLSQDEMDTFMKENAPPPSDGEMEFGGMSGMSGGMGMEPPSKEDMFNSADTDGSGGIGSDELESLLSQMSSGSSSSLDEELFSSYDSDGDGELNEDEMDSFMKDNAPPPPDGGMGFGGMSGMSGMGMEPPSKEDMFNSADTDSSGGISSDELSDLVSQMSSGSSSSSVNVEDLFSSYDSDEDGELDQEEMDSFMKDNAPPPPQQGSGTTQKTAMSAYGMASQSSSFADIFSQSGVTGSGGLSDIQSQFASRMFQNMGTYGAQVSYSPLNIMA